MTCILQSCNAGIIKLFRAHFKRHFATHLVNVINEKNKVEYLTVKMAIHMISNELDKITKYNTIHLL